MEYADSTQVTRRGFLKIAGVSGAALLVGGLAGCAGGSAGQGGQGSASSSSTVGSSAGESGTSAGESSAGSGAAPASDSLVLVFSRADENYNVGYIDVGNTMVLAQFIQEKTGADLFELVPADPYPADYQGCIERAQDEQDENARPALRDLPDLAPYSIVYFGFPVWWGDIPMPVYTAIEALDWQGKTIAPFSTHEGSGDAGMFDTLARVCAGATVLDGLALRGTIAQNQSDEAEQRVTDWLAGLEA